MGSGFGAVDGLFASLHNIRDDKRVAFRARLKHLQRLGFPPGVNTGTGRAAVYGGEQIFLLGVALEMLQLGLSPERAVSVIRNNQTPISAAARIALTGIEMTPSGPRQMFLRFDPSALNELSTHPADEAEKTLWYGADVLIADFIKKAEKVGTRLALINVTALILDIRSVLHVDVGSVAVTDFESGLAAWIATDPYDEYPGEPKDIDDGDS
jgi:hypothetical protein